MRPWPAQSNSSRAPSVKKLCVAAAEQRHVGPCRCSARAPAARPSPESATRCRPRCGARHRSAGRSRRRAIPRHEIPSRSFLFHRAEVAEAAWPACRCVRPFQNGKPYATLGWLELCRFTMSGQCKIAVALLSALVLVGTMRIGRGAGLSDPSRYHHHAVAARRRYRYHGAADRCGIAGCTASAVRGGEQGRRQRQYRDTRCRPRGAGRLHAAADDLGISDHQPGAVQIAAMGPGAGFCSGRDGVAVASGPCRQQGLAGKYARRPDRLRARQSGQGHLWQPGCRHAEQHRLAAARGGRTHQGDDGAVSRHRAGLQRSAWRHAGLLRQHDAAIGRTAARPRGQGPGDLQREAPSAAARRADHGGSRLPGPEIDTWYALYAPAGTPQRIVDRLSGEIKKICERPDFKARVEKSGATIYYMGPEQLDRIHRAGGGALERCRPKLGIPAQERNGANYSNRSSCAASRSTTASCCRRCASTRRRTASPATGTSRIWAPMRWPISASPSPRRRRSSRRAAFRRLCLGLYSDAHQEALARILKFYRDYGTTKFGIQLAHAGRKSSVAAVVHDPQAGAGRGGRLDSDVAVGLSRRRPHAAAIMTLEDIEEVKTRVARCHAARRARSASI